MVFITLLSAHWAINDNYYHKFKVQEQNYKIVGRGKTRRWRKSDCQILKIQYFMFA